VTVKSPPGFAPRAFVPGNSYRVLVSHFETLITHDC